MNSAADFDDVPINRWLGLKLRRTGPEGATVAFEPQAQHLQEYGVVHGGIIATLADTAAVYAFRPSLAATEQMTSIEFKINFLAAASATGGELVATSSVVRRGRSVGVAEVTVVQGTTAIAKGLFTYLFR